MPHDPRFNREPSAPFPWRALTVMVVIAGVVAAGAVAGVAFFRLNRPALTTSDPAAIASDEKGQGPSDPNQRGAPPLAAGVAGATGQASGGSGGPSPDTSAVVTARGDLAPAEQTTIEIFRNASPAVVYITSMARQTHPFSRNVMEIPQGTGSGLIWDDDGHILTNFHVIQQASGARVTLADQTTWDAQLVGAAPDKDLAVLRIQAPREKLTPLAIGTSHDLVVGQHVFAIGNPFGLDHTLSTGVISGLNREIRSVTGRPIQGVVQTDAAINPGNSGGPLLDSGGRMIGINTAIYSPSGAYAGIGFAVPADTVARIVPQLIQHGRVVRPGLGVQIAEQELTQRLGNLQGVLILDVIDSTAAARAGLRPTQRDPRSGAIILGDLIVGIDGEVVREPNDLYRVLDRHDVGEEVALTIQRSGQELQLSLALTALPD